MLLACNPEFYSAWNYRREILLAIFSQENTERLISADLELTQRFMRKHPKVYWLWNHRRWCLVAVSERLREVAMEYWKRELALVELMLEIDARNCALLLTVMGWNYRRWVVEQIAAVRLAEFGVNNATPFPNILQEDIPDGAREALVKLTEAELAYSMRKIEENFSNFSAWHQRTKLLVPVWDAKKYSEDDRKRERAVEFDALHQGMYTDPSDQSLWLYHKWLVEQGTSTLTAPTRETLESEIAFISELAELEPDSKCGYPANQGASSRWHTTRACLLPSTTSTTAVRWMRCSGSSSRLIHCGKVATVTYGLFIIVNVENFAHALDRCVVLAGKCLVAIAVERIAVSKKRTRSCPLATHLGAQTDGQRQSEARYAHRTRFQSGRRRSTW